jgi:glycosyltransferase XagB
MRPISPSDRLLGDLLVARRVLTLEQLDEVVRLAETWEVRLADAVLSRSWSEPQRYYCTIAEHFDPRFVNLIEEPPDPALLRAADADFYAQRLTIPWARDAGRMLIATAEPGPETLLLARQRWGAAIGFVVASKFDIILAVQRAFDDALSNRAVFELAELDPEMSARQVVTWTQASVGYGLVSVLLLSLAVSPIATLVGLSIAMSVFYLGNFLLRAILVTAGGGRSDAVDHEIALEARQLRASKPAAPRRLRRGRNRSGPASRNPDMRLDERRQAELARLANVAIRHVVATNGLRARCVGLPEERHDGDGDRTHVLGRGEHLAG